MKWIKYVVIGGVIVFLAFAGGCTIGKKSEAEKIERKLEQIRSVINAYYLEDADADKLETGIYKGIVEGLEDPYSSYFTDSEYQKLEERIEGSYVGIGVSVVVDKKTGGYRVVDATDDGPAYKAGIRAGDILLKADGESFKGMDSDTAVGKLRGEEGTKVAVTYKSAETGEEITKEIERHSVDVSTVESQMLDDDIGYIQISKFDKVTPEQFNKALTDLEAKGQKGLIIDVRDNPGGIVDATVKILNNILPKGTVCYTEDKNGQGDTYTSDGKNEFNKPLVVLVDSNSASAAEILTGAIKDYNKGTIVGTTTYGKGVIQQVFPLGDGSYVKLTTAKYYTPKGVCIHGKGIEPDVKVEYDGKANESGTYDITKDNQVNKAIEIVKNKIK